MTDNGDDLIWLIHKPELLGLLGIHASTLHEWIKVGRFPAGRVLNPGAGREMVAWKRRDIEQWVDSRPQRLAKPISQRAYDKVRAKAKGKPKRIIIRRPTK